MLEHLVVGYLLANVWLLFVPGRATTRPSTGGPPAF